MTNSRSTSFEVQVLKDKRWVLSQVVGDETAAIAFADNLLSSNNHEAVRVVRDFKRADGLHSETVVSEKTATLAKPEISVAPVSEAPICDRLQDGYALSSRLVIGRLFRRYLDEVMLTPTELLHHGRELKRLADKDRLLMSAVDQVAALQAPEGGEAAKARRDFLHKSWEQISSRARNAAPAKLPKGLSVAELNGITAATPEEADYQRLVLISALLAEQKSWMGKLDRLLFWVADTASPPLMPLLDGLIADCLMPAEAIQDLMGFLPNLAAALIQMVDLAEGRAQPTKQAPESFATLNALLAGNRLPQTRDSLLGRVTRELRGANPLSRNEPTQEYEAFIRILGRMIAPAGLIGGSAMAESLLQRGARQQSIGGVGGLLAAMDDIVMGLGDRCRIVLYLLALAGSAKLAAACGPPLRRKLTEIVGDGRWIDGWVPPNLPPRERMVLLHACHRAIAADQLLDPSVRKALADRTDAVLARYLEEDQVIEKIDKPEDPLAFRALRLVKFCCSGVLIQGRSLELAHKRVLGHLRQPQFEEKFLSSIPDQSQAEKHLREFHKLLMESGFKF